MAVAGADFPLLCEACLGTSPYVKMQRTPGGGTCKMCTRNFELFKWRPGRGESYKRTEVCRICAEMKNICQTCILDLRFGLPSQLRDAVLSYSEVGENNNISSRESDMTRDYQIQEYLKKSDEDKSHDSLDNKILRMARAVTQNREQHQIVVGAPSSSSSSSSSLSAEAAATTAATVKLLSAPSGSLSSTTVTLPDASSQPSFCTTEQVPSNPPITDVIVAAATLDTGKGKKKRKVPVGGLPPRPPGPPPAWAFKSSEKP